MKFKSPRDPSTKPDIQKIRDVHPSDGILCEVGSGECRMLAVESQDNGEGGEFFLCEQHSAEFVALAMLIAEMTPNQIVGFEQAVSNAEPSVD